MKLPWILIPAAALLGTCQPTDTRTQQMRRWLSQSRQGCQATAAVLKGLRRGVATFEKIYAEEMVKTKRGKRPLQRYNPGFLSRLQRALPAVDSTRGALAKRLTQEVWTSHVRFVKHAPQVLPRLHRLLVLLAELRSTVTRARVLEKRYAKLLASRGPQPPKSAGDFRMGFGARILDDRRAEFLSSFSAPARRGIMPRGCLLRKDAMRMFLFSSAELYNRVDCRGRAQIVYTAYLYHLMQIKLILAAIKQLDLRGLTIAFSRSAE